MSIPEWLLSVRYPSESMDSREKLNTELETLLYWLSLSKAEIQIRRKIRDEIQSIVTNSTDSCKIDMVGSFVSGM